MQRDLAHHLDVLGEALKPPFQVVQAELSNEWIFPISHCPSEVQSDAEPPIRIGANPELIEIDVVLGLYKPNEQQITIFSRGIKQVAELLGAPPVDLAFVVRLHEWAHAVLHTGLTDDERLRVTADESLWPECLSRSTAWFVGLDTLVHERLAQLLTYHGLRSLRAEATHPEAQATLDRIARNFDSLTRRTPVRYRIDHLLGAPKGRIRAGIRLLKDNTLVGASAWETVMTW